MFTRFTAGTEKSTVISRRMSRKRRRNLRCFIRCNLPSFAARFSPLDSFGLGVCAQNDMGQKKLFLGGICWSPYFLILEHKMDIETTADVSPNRNPPTKSAREVAWGRRAILAGGVFWPSVQAVSKDSASGASACGLLTEKVLSAENGLTRW